MDLTLAGFVGTTSVGVSSWRFRRSARFLSEFVTPRLGAAENLVPLDQRAAPGLPQVRSRDRIR